MHKGFKLKLNSSVCPIFAAKRRRLLAYSRRWRRMPQKWPLFRRRSVNWRPRSPSWRKTWRMSEWPDRGYGSLRHFLREEINGGIVGYYHRLRNRRMNSSENWKT